MLSIDYACTDCGVSFEPPSPQLFSFNSPQGMCLECDGLGESIRSTSDCLIPDPTRSFKQGCFELIGPWKEMGRWRRHIYPRRGGDGRACAGLGRGHDAGDALAGAGGRVAADVGCGAPATSTSRSPGEAVKSPMKYGGTFDGIIPDLLEKYRNSKSRMQIRQLERYMSTIGCPACQRPAAERAGL